MKISKNKLQQIIKEEVSRIKMLNEASGEIDLLFSAAQKLCDILPFECVASIQWATPEEFDPDIDNIAHVQFYRSFNFDDVLKKSARFKHFRGRWTSPTHWDASENVFQCVVINLGDDAVAEYDDATNILMINDEKGENLTRVMGRFFITAHDEGNDYFSRYEFARAAACHSFNELDNRFKKRVNELIDDDDSVVIKQNAVEDFNLDEILLREITQNTLQEKVEILEKLVPAVQKICDLLPIDAHPQIHFVDQYGNVSSNEHEAKEKYNNYQFVDYHSKRSIEIGLRVCLILHVGKEQVLDDFSLQVFEFHTRYEAVLGRIVSPSTGRSTNIDKNWLEQQSKCKTYDDLDQALKNCVDDYIEFGCEVKDDAIEDFNLDEALAKESPHKSIIDEAKEKSRILEKLIPTVQKICDLLPIKSLPVIRYMTKDDGYFETIEETIENQNINDVRFCIDVELCAQAGTSFSQSLNADIFLLYSNNAIVHGYVTEFENGHVKNINDTWLIDQSSKSSYDELDPYIRSTIEHMLVHENAEIKDELDINVDLS